MSKRLSREGDKEIKASLDSCNGPPLFPESKRRKFAVGIARISVIAISETAESRAPPGPHQDPQLRVGVL